MKKITILLSCLFLILCSFKGLCNENRPEKIPVFEMNTDGSKFYRIPALITAQDGSLVAIADKRGNEIGDLPNTISVIAKRSTDNGATWSEAITIAQGNAAEGTTYGDPAVVLDRRTGKLICIYAGDNGLWHSTPSKRMGFYISESSNNGITWSEKRSITNQLYERFNWYGAFAASGNALQLKDGRLIFVVAARHTSVWGGPLTNHACYSDDGGQTWNVSQGAGIGDEAKVVELENGDILMSVRNRGFRKFCRSTDRGETWSTSSENLDLPEPACNGDIIRYPSADGETRILQTIPASSTVREKVSIYLSKDEGVSWPVKKQLCDTVSAYSSIAILPDGSIGVLFEEGKWDNNLPGEDGFNLYFVRFTLEWLEGNSENPEPEPENKTLVLDGIERHMAIPNAPELNPEANQGYSITLKVYLPEFTANSFMRLFSKRAFEGTSSSGCLGYEMCGGNSASQFVMANLSLEGKPWGNSHDWNTGTEKAWTHVTWVFDRPNSISRIYVNGKAGSSKSAPEYATNTLTNPFDLLIGAGYNLDDGTPADLDYFLKGEIDDVRIFAKALSQEEILNDINSDVDQNTANLIAAYDFQEIRNNIAPDISGNGHHGRLVGFPAETYPVTIVTPSASEGILNVYKEDGTPVTNGDQMEVGTLLHVEAIPAQDYMVKNIYINNVALETENNTFNVEKATRVSAEFWTGPDYCIPTGTISENRYLTRIFSEGSTGETGELEYSSDSPLKQVYVKLDSELTVAAGSTFKITFVGNNSSFDGLKYTHAEIFADWNGDLEFNETDGEWIAQIGECAPENSSGWSNGEKMDLIEQQFTVPADAVTGNSRIRIKYTDAWHNRGGSGFDPDHGPCSRPGKGMIYDIPVKIDMMTGTNQSLYEESSLHIYPNPFKDYLKVTGLEPGAHIQLFAIDGMLLSEETVAENTYLLNTQSLNQGSYILKINQNGLIESFRILK